MKMAQSPDTPTNHINMISTVSLIKPQVIDDDDDDDDDGTSEDIFISVPIGDEHRQDKKVNVKTEIGASRNVMSIRTLEELFGENGSTKYSCQRIWELRHQKCLDVTRLATGRKESNIEYCGTLAMPTGVLHYSATESALQLA